MKRVLLITTLLTSLLTARTYSQNIYSALHHNREEEVRNKVPLEIVEENTFYNSSAKETRKNIKKLNSKKRIVLEERFAQNGELEARLTYAYDSSGLHSLTRKFERWTVLEYSSETAFYTYDVNWHLVRVTDKADKGGVIQETLLVNNEKGDPTHLELLDGNGNAYGIEKAIYHYEANKAYTEVLDAHGRSLSRDTLTIDFNIKDPAEEFNEHGDLVGSPKYSYEYEYDEFGNWTVMKIFRIVKNKRKNDRMFKRKLKYSN